MSELPSMDDILRDADRRERRTSVRLGLFLVLAGVAVMFGLHALVPSDGSHSIYFVPGGTIVFGLGLLLRR